jgi:predicted transcriptional regulator
MNGSKHDLGQTSDGKTRVVNAFQDLIKTVYSSLRMLGTTQYSEDTIKATVVSRQDDLFGADDATISEAESEVLNSINRRKKQADRTSLNDIKTRFSLKPYGWYPNAIWTITARLYKRGKIEVLQGSNSLEDQDVLNALLNSSKHGTTLLEPQASFDLNAVKKLKQVYKDAFNESCPLKEPKDVANAFKNEIKEIAVGVNQLLARKNEYHFLKTLEDFSEKLDKLSKKEYSYFITNLADFEDNLLDTKEDLLDPIKRFMNGDQVKIYDEVKKLLNSNNANLNFIEGDEVITLEAILESDTPYKGNGIQLAKASKDSLTKKVLEAIDTEKEIFNTKISAIEKAILESEEFGKIDDGQQRQIQKTILDLKKKIIEERFIGNIKDVTRTVDDYLYSDQMNLMALWLTPKTEEGKTEYKTAKYIKKSNIRVDFVKHELTNEEDVEAYVEALKKAYLERIRQNLKITL